MRRLLPANWLPILLSVLQNKGGVGKSTAALALAAGLALRGYKVLVLEVENSPRLWQLVTPGFLMGEPEPSESQTTYGLFANPELGFTSALYDINQAPLIQRVPSLNIQMRENLIASRGWQNAGIFYLLPGHGNLWQMNDILLGNAQKRSVNADVQLAHALRGLLDFDYIIMDTPPSRNTLQSNVLKAREPMDPARASQYVNASQGVQVIVPVDFDPQSKNDFKYTEGMIDEAANECHAVGRPEPEILGVVYNKFDATDEEVDCVIYREYTQKHINNYTRHEDKPLIQYPELGILPLATKDIKRTMLECQSVHTLIPTKPIGVAAFQFVLNVEKKLGTYPFALPVSA